MDDGILLELTAIAGVFVVLMVVLTLTQSTRQKVLALAVGASAGLMGVQLFSIHLFTLLVITWFLFARSTPDRSGMRHVLLLLASSAILASTVFLGDLVNSPTLALQLLGLTASAALIVLGSRRLDRDRMLVGLLTVVSAGSFVALLQVGGLVSMKLWHLDISSVGRPTGIYPEPDWLGMFAAIGVILVWRMPRSYLVRISLFLINAAAVVLSFARAAWLALIVSVLCGVLLYIVSRRKMASGRERTGRIPALILAGIIATITLVVNSTFRNDILARIGTMLGGAPQPDDISGQARARQTDLLLELASDMPPWGHGLSASGRVSVWGAFISGESTNNVASNWVLAMWVDGAYFALPLIAMLAYTAIRGARSVAGQALIVVLVSSLFSNGTFFPVTWLLIAVTITEISPLRLPPFVEQSVGRSVGASPCSVIT